ncbi:MAG: bifunctional glutamate N-acetyltransferase/amino-acid acetyltransferase ArgJ [Actinomycetota bacterium]
MSVTFPRGFKAAGMTAGLKPSGRPDLALLAAERECSAAGLFTTNSYPAAPVELSRARLQSGKARAVLVNSGDANAGRGEEGKRDAESTTKAAAAALGVPEGEVLACSTGVIGGSFDAAKIGASSGVLVDALSPDGGAAFAGAICTTDTVIKQAQSDAGAYLVGACAKGAAMVEPDLELATMLVFFTTDAPIEPPALRELAAASLKPAFEQLTIDGCTSTNDTVLVLASGAAGGDLVAQDSADFRELAAVMRDMADSLAYQLAADAEGGTKVLIVDVTGAEGGDEAQKIAKAIANSILVKCAVFGADPNPGRLLQAVGASGASFDPSSVTIRLGDVVVSDGGVVPRDYDEGGVAHRVMKEDEIDVSVEVGNGPGRARAVGCDLSYDYVKINAEYTT